MSGTAFRKDGTAAIERALDLLEAVVRADGDAPFSAIAAELSLPPSTAHRMARTLARRGLIAPAWRGRYVPGLRLAGYASPGQPHRTISQVARPLLRDLARRLGVTAHLGVLDSDMVTYLVKEGDRAGQLFTREGQQLEAYASAIGKVLLANLSAERRASYLAAGPFVALTARTVIEPEAIARELARAGAEDLAIDDEEIADGLVCVAVPVRLVTGEVVAAVSVSRVSPRGHPRDALDALRTCANRIAARLDGREPSSGAI